MLSSEKSIFENYDCGDPCQRKNAAVMVKTMHQNGLHDILPVLYKVTSILATIPATLCSAERSFSALRRIKTFLAVSPLLTLKDSTQTRQCRMTCKGLLIYLGDEVIVLHTSFRAQMGTFYLSLHGFVFQKCSSRFTENICTILNARALTAWRRKLDVTKESSCASVTNKFHSGKLCSAPPTKFFPYADA